MRFGSRAFRHGVIKRATDVTKKILPDLSFVIEERGPKSALLEGLRTDALRGNRPPFQAMRSLNFSINLGSGEALRRLAAITHTPLHIMDPNDFVFVNDDVAAAVGFAEKRDYITLHGSIYGTTQASIDSFYAAVEAAYADVIIRDPMFRLVWHFSVDKGDTRQAVIDERADDVLLDEAYPTVGGIQRFVHEYIASPESILLLIGPPGTGKTRFIRYIMGEMARLTKEVRVDSEKDSYVESAAQYNEHDRRITGIYTSDNEVLSKGGIFADFLIGDAHALIVEDADHLLKSRDTGNSKLHYFLNAADGVIRAKDRKIIFSTNLPNISDVDDALVRAGRCFSVLHLRHLSPAEAATLARALGRDDYPAPRDETTVADVYKWVRENTPREPGKPKVSLVKEERTVRLGRGFRAGR